MRVFTGRELKNRTGEALDLAGRGERVLVTRRGKPVAWLIPADPADPLLAKGESPEEAWGDILTAIETTEPQFATWQEATSWARDREAHP